MHKVLEPFRNKCTYSIKFVHTIWQSV